MFSALLGFAAVLFLHMPQSAMITRGGQNIYVPLFVIVLVSQVLLEILAKYQGKWCDTIEGLFTALVAVLGYTLYSALASRGILGGATQGYGAQGYGMQGAAPTGMGQALLAGAIVALCLFVWKKWLKPALGLGQALCRVRPQIVVQQAPQQAAAPVVVQQAPPATQQPAQQQPAQQPTQQESYTNYY